jgi:hypothetical protein
MTWLTWRQLRIPAASVFAGLVAVGVVLVITGPGLVGRTSFSDEDFLFGATVLVLYLLPVVIGAFWGVPLVTRELENGTHNLVWNQSVTRESWLASKLGVGALAAVLAAGLLSLGVNWWASPIDALASQDPQAALMTRMAPLVFGARGVVPIGYAAFAFVLGVAIGILLRRTVTAMAVTLVAFVAVMVAVPLLLRPYALPAAQETVAITTGNIWQITGTEAGVVESITVAQPAGSWVLTNETVDPDGNVVTPLPQIVQDCLPGPHRGSPPDRETVTACFTRLTDAGYRQHLSYHPASHFWPLQWLELAFFLALSALLTWFCFRRIRHL